MRKSVITALTTLVLAGGPGMVGTVYADTGAPSAAGQDVAAQSGIGKQIGAQTDVLRHGANPYNPSEYPYLPNNLQPPTIGSRSNYPVAPPRNSSEPSTSVTSTSGGTTTNSNTTTSSTTMSPNSMVSANGKTDANTFPDIAIGKPYTIGTQWPDETFHNIESRYANTGQLTDGQYATLGFTDPGWIGMLRQYGRSVVVNLGSVHNVRKVSLDFLQNLGAGIDFPDSVTYYASDDGTHWYKLGTAWTQQGGGDYTPQTQNYPVETNVNAQYIRAQFEDKVFAFMDEFSVYGQPIQDASAQSGTTTGEPGEPSGQSLQGPSLTQTMGDDYLVDPSAPGLPSPLQALTAITSDTGTFSVSRSPKSQTQIEASGQQLLSKLHALQFPFDQSWLHTPLGHVPSQQGYLLSSDKATGGINNMQLVYTGSHGSIGEWSKSDFLPMIAQEDASGKPSGWLFDATLFGPYSSNTPQTSAGWSAWLNDLFSPNVELSALNQAVGTLKQQLNDPNFKEKVVITIPGLNKNSSDFGVVGASGQNLDLNPNDVGQIQSTINKVKAINWYMNQVLSQWNKAGLSNLQLAGFYWEPESLNAAQPLDAELVEATSMLVHKDHLKFYWIPYYGAPGITEWKQLGFDAVTVQSGVSFNFSINPQTRLKSSADQAKYYHMGLEMEQHWNVVNANERVALTPQNRYFDYFTAGNLYGFEGPVMKTWYLNSKTLLTAYHDTNPFYHRVYDNTVKFVNGQWTQTTFH